MCRNKEVKNDVKFFGLIIGRMELLFIEMRRLQRSKFGEEDKEFFKFEVFIRRLSRNGKQAVEYMSLEVKEEV